MELGSLDTYCITAKYQVSLRQHPYSFAYTFTCYLHGKNQCKSVPYSLYHNLWK